MGLDMVRSTFCEWAPTATNDHLITSLNPFYGPAAFPWLFPDPNPMPKFHVLCRWF